MAGEFDYISWLRTQTPPHPWVLIGPGDDAAVLRPPARPLLVTVDMLMDGTDFVLAECGPRAAGRKAMAVNLSDIAAMAGGRGLVRNNSTAASGTWPMRSGCRSSAATRIAGPAGS